MHEYIFSPPPQVAQSAGAIEYTDCPSVEGLNFPNECLANDTKKSEGETPFLELWGIWSTSFIAMAPRSTDSEW